MRKTVPVARRVLGEGNGLTLGMHLNYAQSLYRDADATLDDLREAVTTLEVAKRTARRVYGGAHPHTSAIEGALRYARAALRARETPSPPGSAKDIYIKKDYIYIITRRRLGPRHRDLRVQ